MASPKRYEVYDKITGKLLVEGTARYCSEVLHVGGDAIRAIARGKYNSQKFVVIEQEQEREQEQPEKDLSPNGTKAAAKAWDAFMEPLRKKYGIPVRRMDNGK